MFQSLTDITVTYLTVMATPPALAQMLLAVALTVGLYMVSLRRPLPRPVMALPLGIAFGVGAYHLWTQRALFDDAYISFRYARNLLDGNGLVYNPGEYTEGYTNFLWMMVIAGFSLVTRAEIPLAAFLLNIAVWLTCIVGAYLLEQRLAPRRALPLAPALVAGHLLIAAYGTTGMETLFGATLVLFAVFQLRERPWLAGLLMSLAVLHRLDHAVFWCAGLVGVAAASFHRDGLRGVARPALLYLAPVTAVGVYLAWKLWYYGDLLPNTFYAKEGHGFRGEQGALYLYAFLLGTHAWLLSVPLGAFMARRWREHPAIVAFLAAALPVWALYILKVGGDFMYGRFCLPLFPLVIVVSSIEVWKNTRPHLLLAITAASFGGVMILPVQGRPLHRWGQAWESRVYPVRGLWPVAVEHVAARQGEYFDEVFRQRGIEPYLGTCCIGMLGYYSMLPMLDFHGLTDREIARKPLEGRGGLPGHEKMATPDEIRARGVHFARWIDRDPAHLRSVSRVAFPRYKGRPLQGDISIVTWDQELMTRIQAEVPEIDFVDFPWWLDDYIRRMARYRRQRVKNDLVWFRGYYFDHNQDPERLEKLTRYIETGELPEGALSPEEASKGPVHPRRNPRRLQPMH